jgi:membrane fusion protein (multidrug efflux system)
METTRQAPKAPDPIQAAPAAPSPPAAEGPPEKKAMNPALRAVLIVAGAIVLVVVLIAVIRFLAYATTHQTTDDAQIDSDQVDVTSKIAERIDRVLVDTNQQVTKGQLLIQLDDRDERQRYLQAKASHDALIQQARAAQANVALTRDTVAAQSLQSTGSIAQAESAISGASEQARSASQQIAAAQAAVAAAQAEVRSATDAVPAAGQNLQKAQADYNRTASLVKTGDIAASQLDAARAALAVARSSYSQSQANVAAAQADLDQAQQKLDAQRFASAGVAAQIGVEQGTLTTAQGHLAESSSPNHVAAEQATADAASAQIATAEAQLKTAQDQLSYTQIRSPINGYVGAKNIEIGATVQPGQALLTIIPNRIYVTANFKETQIGNMRDGQSVDIGVDAYKGVNFEGRVQTISPASENKFSLVPAQNATGNFVKVTQRVPVRIVFVNPDAKYPLRPGMSVEASVKVK